MSVRLRFVDDRLRFLPVGLNGLITVPGVDLVQHLAQDAAPAFVLIACQGSAGGDRGIFFAVMKQQDATDQA